MGKCCSKHVKTRPFDVVQKVSPYPIMSSRIYATIGGEELSYYRQALQNTQDRRSCPGSLTGGRVSPKVHSEWSLGGSHKNIQRIYNA